MRASPAARSDECKDLAPFPPADCGLRTWLAPVMRRTIGETSLTPMPLAYISCRRSCRRACPCGLPHPRNTAPALMPAAAVHRSSAAAAAERERPGLCRSSWAYPCAPLRVPLPLADRLVRRAPVPSDRGAVRSAVRGGVRTVSGAPAVHAHLRPQRQKPLKKGTGMLLMRSGISFATDLMSQEDRTRIR